MDIFSTTLRILPKDNKTHVSLEFYAPEGLKCISVATRYAPKYEYDEEKCISHIDRGLSGQDIAKPLDYAEKRRCIPLANHIAWSLDDGEKLLGTEHRHKPDQTHIISEVYSSNGFIKTKVRGGRWKLIASINSIVTDYIDIAVEVKGYDTYPEIRADGSCGDKPIDAIAYASYKAEQSAPSGVGKPRNSEEKRRWQRVEMHCHTVASDGDMQPEELARNALQRGYKGICLTDHNTTSNVDEVKRYGEKYGLAVAGGIEWTTFWGHLTVIGGGSDVKWLDITKENINSCIKRAREAGDIVTLAHPKRIGSPLCAGCHNEFDIDMGLLTSYEVWSHYEPSLSPANLLAKREWVGLLDRGYKICALYGYDWHAPDEGAPCYAYTYLGIDGLLSQDSIIQAVKRGRSYITMGYDVEIGLSDGRNSYGVGDTAAAGEYILSVKCRKAKDYPYDSVLEKIAICSDIFGELEFECVVGQEYRHTIVVDRKGYLRIEGRGKVEGKASDIFIASPIYIKE